MTIEETQIVDLCDIRRIVFECSKCEARISTPFPYENMPAAVKCPSCYADWQNIERQPYGKMLFELEEQLKANSREGATFKIRLEIEDKD